VLVDALFGAGVSGYAAPSAGLRARLAAGAPPFGGAAFALATHDHADHFDPAVVASFLRASPDSRFVSTPQAMAQLRGVSPAADVVSRAEGQLPAERRRETREHRGIKVQLLNVHHGRQRPIDNLGFLLELPGYRVLHIGDSEATASDLRALGLAADRVDVFFVPYWYFMDADGRQAVRETSARHIVIMHVASPAIDGAIRRAGGFRNMLERIRETFPNALWLERELERVELH
jgi:L-ascorbate metabolism protein UlaG (beta-lactamase superfamily)